MIPRHARVVVVGSLAFACLSLVFAAPGCQDATQVTLDIELSDRAECSEIHGTAITVGVDPDRTEESVRRKFVAASTNSCNPTTRAIGTLVVTPGDTGRGTVVVVAAYRESDPTKCEPPSFTGCIVARRRFAFAEHRQLRMPIRLDPECADVPCDAFTTCRTGKCFDSESTCDGDTCMEPGALADGGTSPDSRIPDGGMDGTAPGEAGMDGSLDAGEDTQGDGGGDAGGDGAVDPIPYCAVPGPILHCRNGSGDVACSLASTCCDTAVRTADCNPTPGTCTGPKYCCTDSECSAAGYKCVGQTMTKPGRCVQEDAGSVYCANNGLTLMCPPPSSGGAIVCNPGTMWSCCQPIDVPQCTMTPMCQGKGTARYCCVNGDCGPADSCGPLQAGDDPGMARTCSKTGPP